MINQYELNKTREYCEKIHYRANSNVCKTKWLFCRMYLVPTLIFNTFDLVLAVYHLMLEFLELRSE